MARAFATCPDLLLFDEPFSALDARTREQLRLDLAIFVRSAGIPAIFVMHDYTDALALAESSSRDQRRSHRPARQRGRRL